MSRSEVTQAKAICATCPVLQDCLSYAMLTEQSWGIWGGLTSPERERLRRRTQ